MSKNKPNKVMLSLLIIFSITAVIMLKLGFLFILIAMLPTLVAYFMDNHSGLPLFKTIGACNVSALLPVIAPMVEATIYKDPFDPVEFMSTPMNWLIVYGGAALGWILIFLCRIISSFIMTIMYEHRIASLERLQKKLIEEWGQNIKQ